MTKGCGDGKLRRVKLLSLETAAVILSRVSQVGRPWLLLAELYVTKDRGRGWGLGQASLVASKGPERKRSGDE